MTHVFQRKAIAEACGKTNFRATARHAYVGTGRGTHPCPNYPACLNAMREAETHLTTEQAWVYNRELGKLLGIAAGIGSGGVDEWPWHASAPQKSEAFLRTLELWVENPKS